MKLTAIPNKILSLLNLRLIRATDQRRQFPVELTKSDKEIFEYVRTNRLSTTSDERLYATVMACRHVVDHDIDGDFVECGVWRGGNSILAANCFADVKQSRGVWLFDTFAGMTAPTGFDVNVRGESAEAKFKASARSDHNDWCYSPIEDVSGYFKAVGLLSDKVKFVKGDVVETLANPTNLPAKIAVLRLDTDWYESTRAELEVLYPLLSAGGILMIDDYGHWGGARKAVDDYFAGRSRPFFQYIDNTGRIAVKR